MMMSFNNFVHIYDLKNKTTSIINFYQVLSSIGLNNVEIYLRDGPISCDVGLVNIHSTKSTHWYYIYTKNFLIHMVVHLLRNYLRIS